ncbi:hypothetical protein BLNAU_20483 [Blattamonas nauphoetae]|uniref:Uncharacterized protein n=1 Tax=Blattamonas nauphoetae TaxID=2049346 RepID=A0ABQ9WYM3_9EUKA|nr:hypothetical protein BLNAU_20483 [Blattamonas nauphoetae]
MRTHKVHSLSSPVGWSVTHSQLFVPQLQVGGFTWFVSVTGFSFSQCSFDSLIACCFIVDDDHDQPRLSRDGDDEVIGPDTHDDPPHIENKSEERDQWVRRTRCGNPA